MTRKFLLNRKCKECGCKIADNNKSGYCNKHRPRSGVNNPMYGKSVKDKLTPEKLKLWRKRLSLASKHKWEDLTYRNKVILANTGKQRTDKFRAEQSVRTKLTYVDYPNLRKMRGKLFKKCWEDGRNHWTAKESTNRSKGEIELFNALKDILTLLVERKTIRTKNNKYYFPDVLINNKIIIEFYGDYYHANPSKYDADYMISKKGITAKEVWLIDKLRLTALENSGYKFIIVWLSDWNKDKKLVISSILNKIKEYEV